ncbi:hypothetical protein EU546_06145 [Candidatus Thorarchaeota archaeon]|nr:MAG: hypothetical protein EU546_06145 [Candidatus Thorarchaeota archaeon]
MKNSESIHDSACMVCGAELIYGTESKNQVCTFCDTQTSSPISCPEGHFVCDDCHSKDSLAFLERLAEVDTSTDPLQVVDKALLHPSFKFHGPEHHSLVPAAILIALKNRGIPRPDGKPVTTDTVLEGIRRGSKIPGGFCGYAGTCGACVGAGVAVALYLGSTPRKGPERRSAHKATTDALSLSQDGLKRCCKRATYFGVTSAMNMLRDEFEIDLGNPPEMKSCQHFARNKDCEEELCPYHASSNC